jgi:hypothetical protein
MNKSADRIPNAATALDWPRPVVSFGADMVVYLGVVTYVLVG